MITRFGLNRVCDHNNTKPLMGAECR